MAKFLTGNELNFEIERIFQRAEAQIIILSPYIKLHERFISTLKTKMDNPKLEIVLVFGKNQDDITRSLKREDFNFFTDFPNIEIRYEKRLHAKFYANESDSILTSMNLYSYSQDNNIEAGVMSKSSFLNDITRSLVNGEDSYDKNAWNYFSRVIDQSKLVFKKTPEYEKSLLGLSKKYTSSKVETDILSEFFSNKQQSKVINNSTSSIDANVQNNKSAMAYQSTTALAKSLGVSSKELFIKLESLTWIVKDKNDWVLTPLGKNKGGTIKNGQYGLYIAWPEAVRIELSNAIKPINLPF